MSKWKTRPYQRGILDAMTDPAIETVVFKKSSRIGYTKMIDIVAGYYIHNNPRNILVVQPTIEDAQGFSKDEIGPMLRDVPVLQELAPEEKTRDSDNTILRKQFPGLTLYMVGANSPRGFRRVSAGLVLFDEVSGYPPAAGREGDQFLLGSRRAEDYWDKKIIAGSTPTNLGVCKITELYEQGDQRQYHVPCPVCGYMQTLEFERMDFSTKGTVKKPVYICVDCEAAIDYGKHRWMIERGEWIAEKPFDGVASFYLWSAYSYSPGATWAVIVREFLNAKENPEKLKTWVNTWRGQEWVEGDTESHEDKAKRLYESRETYESVPGKAGLILASIDTQDDRLECLVKAWGKNEESWNLEKVVFVGNLSQNSVWEKLDVFLLKTYVNENGSRIGISGAVIDTGGHHSDEGYTFVKGKEERNIFAIKGHNQPGKPIMMPPAKGSKADVDLYMVGVFSAKDIITSRLKIPSPGPGYIHFNQNFDFEHCKQVFAERKSVKVTGNKRSEAWVKIYTRNEGLDLEVYNLAVLRMFFPDMHVLNEYVDSVILNKPFTENTRERKYRSRGIRND